MRNLKRVLSLALAALMLMGMMVVGAGAASKDFTDASEIKNVEAVDVMVALGVLEGGDKGDFQPNSILTREQAAKIICYMLLGEEAAEKLTTNYSIFSDVPANRWSAPYISYCVNLGILAGDGNGHFYPEGKLTGVAFAKMLMVALGYNAERENFIGNNWEINVSARAIETGIAPKGLVLSEKLSRQDAAQMAFNTLKATMVEYQNDTTIIVGGTTVSTSSKATPVAQGSYANTMGAANLQFAEKNFPDLKKIPDTDAFMRPATTWRNGNTTVGTYADAADATYTAPVAIGTIYSDLGLSKGIPMANTTVYEDGVATTSTTTVNGVASTNWGDIDIVKGQTAKIGGNGVLTEVYYDGDNNTVTIVVINTYVAKVAAAYAASTTRDAYVTLTTPNTGSGVSFETEGFAKDDIVLYTYSNKVGERCIESMVKAQAQTGVMTSYTDSKSVTLDGTVYNQSAKAVNISGYNTSVGKSVTVYTDTYGYAIYVDADAALQYAVVLDYASAALLQNARVKLMFTDGTVKVVDLKAAYGTNGTTAATMSNTAFNLSNESSNSGKYNSGDNTIGLYDIVSYTVNSDDEYTLTLAADAKKVNEGGERVTNGSPSVKLLSGNAYNVSSSGSLIADGKTVFLVMDSTGSSTTYSVYTGIAQVPTITYAGGSYATPAAVLSENGVVAKVVFIAKLDSKVSITDSNKDVTFIKGNNNGQSYTSDLGYYYEYDAVINGVEGKIKTENKVQYPTLVSGVAFNSKGIATGWNEYASYNVTGDTSIYNGAANVKTGKGTTAEANSVIGLASTYYAYTDDCKVYYLSTTGELTESTASSITTDTNDIVWFKLTDGLVSTVFVQIVDETIGAGSNAGKLAATSLAKDVSGNLVAGVTLTAAAPAGNAVANVVVEKYMQATNTWLPVATGTVTVASGNTAGQSATLIASGSLSAGEIYRVTATYDGGTLVSANFVI